MKGVSGTDIPFKKGTSKENLNYTEKKLLKKFYFSTSSQAPSSPLLQTQILFSHHFLTGIHLRRIHFHQVSQNMQEDTKNVFSSFKHSRSDNA